MPLEKHLAYPRLRNTSLIHQIFALSSWICCSFTLLFCHSLLTLDIFMYTLLRLIYVSDIQTFSIEYICDTKSSQGYTLFFFKCININKYKQRSIIKRQFISEYFRITRTYLIRMSACLSDIQTLYSLSRNYLQF